MPRSRIFVIASRDLECLILLAILAAVGNRQFKYFSGASLGKLFGLRWSFRAS